MKLLTKTTLWYLLLTLILFAIGGIVFYFSLRNIIDENINESLENTQMQVLNYVEKNGKLPQQTLIGRDILTFKTSNSFSGVYFKDTVIYNAYEDENLPYRKITFPIRINEDSFAAVVLTPTLESDDLAESVANSLGIVAGILLLVLFLLNWFLSKSIWKPFYRTLDSLKQFDVSKKEPMDFPASTISEFKLLNEALNKMTEKITRDYKNLKEFTENASHELQTPLAIIRSKLELMIQTEGLPEEMMTQVQDIYENTNRLSKLNQSLLLLAKIENRQFHETQALDLKILVEKKLSQLEELISLKGIAIEKHLTPAGQNIRMNPQLADILLSNILSNAIRHNTGGGKITVELKKKSLSVSNSGDPLNFPPEKLFERFQKASPSAESVGLGLSIVKQICDTYDFRLNYSFSLDMHTVSVLF